MKMGGRQRFVKTKYRSHSLMGAKIKLKQLNKRTEIPFKIRKIK
jgi:hypothetical protein